MLHLTEAQQHILQMVSSFSQQQIWPNAAKWDAEEYFPKEAFLQRDFYLKGCL